MKVKMVLVLAILFLAIGVCSAQKSVVDTNPVETFKERATEVYWEGYNKLFCKEVRISLIVEAIKLFMENPNLSPYDVLYVKSTSIALEDSCKLGICDRQSGENNLNELLELLDLEIRMYMKDL